MSSSKEAPLLAEKPPPQKGSAASTMLLLAVLVALTVGDSVQGAIMFDKFTEVYAQSVCLGINIGCGGVNSPAVATS